MKRRPAISKKMANVLVMSHTPCRNRIYCYFFIEVFLKQTKEKCFAKKYFVFGAEISLRSQIRNDNENIGNVQ